MDLSKILRKAYEAHFWSPRGKVLDINLQSANTDKCVHTKRDTTFKRKQHSSIGSHKNNWIWNWVQGRFSEEITPKLILSMSKSSLWKREKEKGSRQNSMTRFLSCRQLWSFKKTEGPRRPELRDSGRNVSATQCRRAGKQNYGGLRNVG